ncbi:MAG: hypothetical protein ACYTEP_06555 [Planctomycetota bacterium]|jgi:hypothetical protein
MSFILPLSKIRLADLPQVGGKDFSHNPGSLAHMMDVALNAE